jgi:hypothetical protein
MEALRLQYKAVSKTGRGVRALFSRAPKSAEVLDRAVRLLRRKLPGRCTFAASSGTIAIELHPWASPVKVTAPADGELVVAIAATTLGPGYVRHVLELLDGILDELDFVWAAPPQDGSGDEASAFATTRDLTALQRACTGWLAAQLRLLLDGGHVEDGKQLGIPQEPRLEVDDASVLTPMGPRSRAWCEAVVSASGAGGDAGAGAGSSGADGHDFWPMWEASSTAALTQARGLWLLWVEVPWRLPMGDLETNLMKDAHKALAAAHKLDGKLELPWAEWAELVDILDLDDEVTEEVRRRGIDAAEPERRIGYRRYPARFQLTSGWSLRLTPNFADSWADGGTAMIAADGERSLRCSCAETDGATASEILAKLPMQGDVLARLDEGPYRGRVEARNDEVNGVRLITAIMTTAGTAAVISMVTRYGDEAWAVAAWWTLRHAGVTWTAPSEAPALLISLHDEPLPPEDDPWREVPPEVRWQGKSMHEHWYGTSETPDPSIGPPPPELRASLAARDAANEPADDAANDAAKDVVPGAAALLTDDRRLIGD